MKNVDKSNCNSQSGFTLLEVALASLLMMIVGLGAASVFYYAVRLNSGGSNRGVTIAVAQDVLERYRGLKFDQTTQPNPNNYTVTGSDGQPYSVTVIVTNQSTTLKKVQVTVTPAAASAAWARTPFSVQLFKSKSEFGSNYQP